MPGKRDGERNVEPKGAVQVDGPGVGPRVWWYSRRAWSLAYVKILLGSLALLAPLELLGNPWPFGWVATALHALLFVGLGIVTWRHWDTTPDQLISLPLHLWNSPRLQNRRFEDWTEAIEARMRQANLSFDAKLRGWERVAYSFGAESISLEVFFTALDDQTDPGVRLVLDPSSAANGTGGRLVRRAIVAAMEDLSK